MINLILVLTTWWCPCVESSLVLWKRVFLMTSAFSWQNSVSFCPASLFFSPVPSLPVTSCISWFLLLHSSSLWWKWHLFFGVVLEDLVDHHRPFNFSFFGISGWGIDLVYCDIECFALEMNKGHSVFLKLYPITAFQTLLLTMRATQFLVGDACPR